MDALDIGGKQYVRAAVAAKEVGYTRDYVGQLCRAEKIDAQLVGRTWYVREGALREHKNGKNRSNVTKTKTSFREKLASLEEAEENTEIKEVQSDVVQTLPDEYRPIPAYRKRLLDAKVTYSSDESDVLPKMKSGELTVSESNESIPDTDTGAGEPVSVRVEKDIRSTEHEVTFKSEGVSRAALSGKLTVLEVPEVSTEDSVKKITHTGLANDIQKAPSALDRKVDLATELHMEEAVTNIATHPSNTRVVPPQVTPAPAEWLSASFALVMVVVLTANIFLHTVLTYDRSDNNPSKVQFSSAIGVAAVGSVVESLTK